MKITEQTDQKLVISSGSKLLDQQTLVVDRTKGQVSTTTTSMGLFKSHSESMAIDQITAVHYTFKIGGAAGGYSVPRAYLSVVDGAAKELQIDGPASVNVSLSKLSLDPKTGKAYQIAQELAAYLNKPLVAQRVDKNPLNKATVTDL